MKLIRLKSLVFCCALVATSCVQSHISQELHLCESIIEENPDSAYSLLQLIDTAEIIAGRDVAKYNLLITQARTKLGYVDYSDSLINISTRYYSRSKHSRHYMKSLFYKGNIAHNNLSLSLAIESTTQAYEIALSLNDNYWIAKASELMSDIYSATYNNSEMLKYTQIASENYQKAGKRLNHLFSQCDLATAYANDGKISRAISIIDSVHSIAQYELRDTSLLFYCCRALFPICVFAHKHDRASQCVEELSSYSVAYTLPARYIAYHAQLELERGNRSLARDILNSVDISSLSNFDKTAFYWALCNLNRDDETYLMALNYADSLLKLQNNELDVVLRQATTIAQRDLYNEIAHEEKFNTQKQRVYLVVGIIFFIIILLVSLWIYRLRLRTKNAEIEKKMGDIIILTDRLMSNANENVQLQVSLLAKNNDIKKMSEKIEVQKQDILRLNGILDQADSVKSEMAITIETLFRDKWQILNILCNEFFERGNSVKTRVTILNNIDTEIAKLRSPKNIAEIEATVNKYMNNIVGKLREQCPMIKQADVVFITLVYAGFNPRAVCVFTNIKLKYFYTKKTRLVQRILSSQAPDKELFVSKLD